MSDLPLCVFVKDGALLQDGETRVERFVPTELARGPWHEDSQHGSAMSGLLARAVERMDGEGQVVRLTFELLRAAPLAPVTVRCRPRHAGGTMQTFEAELLFGDEVCARAHGVRYRVAPLDVGDHASDEPPPSLDENARFALPSRGRAFHDGLHLSPVAAFARPAMWVRSIVPLVAGEALSPLTRLSVAADWVYAAPSLRAYVADPVRAAARPFVAINTDNHVVLTRPPEGEWLCLDASALYGSLGAGAVSARLYDQRGVFGFATQTLLQRGLDKRPKAWR